MSVREWFVDHKVIEMVWPAQNPDLKPTEHLWDDLERRLRSRPPTPHITNCSGYSSAGRMGCHSPGDVQTLDRKSSRQSSSCHKGERWAQPVLVSTIGKCITEDVGLVSE
jgi:hypothetical protein